MADPSPSIDEAGAMGERRAHPAIVDCPDECLALIRAIADGGRHRIETLAARAMRTTGSSSVVRVAEALESFERFGMILERDPDGVRARPFTALSQDALQESASGWDAQVVGSTRSTNDDLMRAIRANATFAGPRLIASEVQLSGRGRLGRRWVSTPGASLTASFAVRMARRLSQVDGVTLVCGLAVHDAIAAHGVRAELKWPNDVLFDGAKLGGILVEAHALENATVLVVGIGLNVSARAPIRAIGDGLVPTDLESCGGRALDRNRIVGRIASALATRLDAFDRHGYAPFVDEWRRVDALLGRRVALAQGRGEHVRHGVARGIDGSGALMVEIDGIATRVISGDVTVRPADR